ncbi:Zn-ribbon domain-containing OB-fold protein [Streptomyces sp. NPDC059957]|uniref:Zn-ribbon domain-containing OB-fold protein n=1 Tax=unclassified Streptomyces TaxID=2593676 RepID=UPI00364AA383
MTTTTPATPAASAASSDPGTPADELLLPVPDGDGAPFWEYAAQGELRVQACAAPACGKLRFPPRPCCPHCRSFDSEWRLMSGRGRIWSYVRPHPPLLPAYAAQAPYNVILVELADAPQIRLVGNLVTAADAPLDSMDPARLRIGARVQVVFTETGGMAVPRWMLEKS